MKAKSNAEYAICVTRNYYGPRTTKQRLIGADGYEWRGTHAEARAMIADLDAAVYYTSYGECERATYTIVRA